MAAKQPWFTVDQGRLTKIVAGSGMGPLVAELFA